ncbi:XdhC family protein [bacterium]|nr:XdhC family protein [bacterium]
MDETEAILAGWREVEATGEAAVLATVVHVQGSAYRRPGARMLIRRDGRHVGSISGGCLETDVCRRAWWMTEGGRPTLRVYDTTSEDDAAWEFGLGCNGVVHVLLERADTEPVRQTLAFLADRRATRRPGCVATVVHAAADSPLAVGDRLFLDEGGAPRGGELCGTGWQSALRAQAGEALRGGRSRLVHTPAGAVFVECVVPPPALVIFGAGHDALPLVTLAAQLGWHVTIADGRRGFARADRFPGADRVVLLSREQPLAGLTIDGDSIVVLMTHNFPQDAALLRALLPLRPRYLGVLGSQSRRERLLAEIDGAAADLHAPIGLDIGADTPELIALAIVAEIQAELSGRAGGKMRLRDGPIHRPVEEIGCAAPLGEPAEHPVCALAVGDV